MQRLLIRQATQMIEEAIHLLLDGRVLLVGADHVLALPHNVSIGFNFGDRFGSHNSVIPSVSRRDAFAVCEGSSSSNRATCQPQ